MILGGSMAGVMFVLARQMRQIAVEEAPRFRLLAEENRVAIRLVPPVRGLLFDRTGAALAYNEASYKIDLVREQAKDPELILRRLSEIVPLSEEQIVEALEEMRQRRGFLPVTVAENLTWDDVAKVSANAPALPGVTPILGHDRVYPFAADFAHIVGRVGPVSDYDLSKSDDDDPLLLIPRFQIGKTGVEKVLEKPLRGLAGLKRIEVNAIGRTMRVLDSEVSQKGANAQLTVHNGLQNFVQSRLAGESAAAVVMDVRNGDLLCVASAPSYDPNLFVRGISTRDWNALNTNKYKPLLNKAASGAYPPGSTFKMVTALAALRDGKITTGERITCEGHIELHFRKFHCWKRGGHGRMNLHNSLKESCDVYYYDLAQRVGIDKISQMARELGIGVRHDVELLGVAQGLAPTKAWKSRVKGDDWVIGDSLNASIGQGFVLATPLQLAVMTARLATGTQISPRLINALDNVPQPVRGQTPLDIDPRYLSAVRKAMFGVVHERGGTARASALNGAEMAGKTGTSQVRFITPEEREKGVIRNEDLPWERRDHALFVGYAPYQDPKYAISVVVEHGGGGSAAAAPIAKDILDHLLTLGELQYGAPQPPDPARSAGAATRRRQRT